MDMTGFWQEVDSCSKTSSCDLARSGCFAVELIIQSLWEYYFAEEFFIQPLSVKLNSAAFADIPIGFVIFQLKLDFQHHSTFFFYITLVIREK